MKPHCLAVAVVTLATFVGTTMTAAAQKTDKPVPDVKKLDAGKVQEVIAEGVGKTVEDALKEAFRAAVRQVVGAVVDEQIQLQNDAIISDKVLTASGGFVAGYEQLKKEEANGLVRIRIKAKVEKSELVDKLREFKITVRAIDTGKIIPKLEDLRFSDEKVKAMSKEEMTANKTEILQDALADLPKVIEARAKAPDRFDYDAATSNLNVEVIVAADNERYIQFLKRLLLRLDKLSLSKGFASIEGKPADINWGNLVRGFTAEAPALLGPDLSRQRDAWYLWVMTNSFREGAGSRWTGYALDADVRKTLGGLHGMLEVQVTLLDAEGKTIVEQKLDLSEGNWLGNYTPHPKANGWTVGGRRHTQILKPTSEQVVVSQENTVHVMLAPMEFGPQFHPGVFTMSVTYALQHNYPLKFKLDKDEVKRLKDIRCAVQFRAEK